MHHILYKLKFPMYEVAVQYQQTHIQQNAFNNHPISYHYPHTFQQTMQTSALETLLCAHTFVRIQQINASAHNRIAFTPRRRLYPPTYIYGHPDRQSPTLKYKSNFCILARVLTYCRTRSRYQSFSNSSQKAFIHMCVLLRLLEFAHCYIKGMRRSLFTL